MDKFEIASGSVPGYHHVNAERNNQDALSIIEGKDVIAACVCDGCGSTPHAELGARLGANMIVKAAIQQLSDYFADGYSGTIFNKQSLFFRDLTNAVLGKMEDTIRSNFCSPTRESARDHFLFTCMGLVVTKEVGCVFSFGDGAWAFNGNNIEIAFEGNAPPYLGHYFTRQGVGNGRQFNPEAVFLTKEINSILVGSDGCGDIVKSSEKEMPGKAKGLVGSIDQFWTNDDFFKNQDAVRRRLASIGKVHKEIDWEDRVVKKTKPILLDDTTLVVLRRKKEKP